MTVKRPVLVLEGTEPTPEQRASLSRLHGQFDVVRGSVPAQEGTFFLRSSETWDADLDRVITSHAANVLLSGGLIALPTETVYGLAAAASQRESVRRIFAVKGRPVDHPLIVHVADASQIDDWADVVPPAASVLAAHFWPGPLTMILPKGEHVISEVTGGQDTVGLRMPSHPMARAILARVGGVAAPSANKFGKVSPTRAEHVITDLRDEVDFVADGGACDVGIESTIVDLSSGAPAILRPGAITQEAMEAVLGHAITTPVASSVRAPGLLPSHYAPRAQVVLAAKDDIARYVEAARTAGRTSMVLELPEDSSAFARRLYAALREADLSGVDEIIVEPPREDGLGRAILDRLRKASAKRN